MSQLATFDLGFATATAAALLPRTVVLPPSRTIRIRPPVAPVRPTPARTRTRSTRIATAASNGIRIGSVMTGCGWFTMLLASITLASGLVMSLPQLAGLGIAFGLAGAVLLFAGNVARGGILRTR